MAAAAYKGTLVFRNGANTNSVQITASDVAAAYYLMPDGQQFLVLAGSGVWTLTDVILTGTGTDTSKTEIFVNGKSSGEFILNAVNQSTTVTRQFASAPIKFYAGSQVSFIQRA
jgi:hypothetical protein